MQKSQTTPPPRLRMPAAPWIEGYLAGRSGSSDPCQYSVESVNGWSWSAGYVEGAAARYKERQFS